MKSTNSGKPTRGEWRILRLLTPEALWLIKSVLRGLNNVASPALVILQSPPHLSSISIGRY